MVEIEKGTSISTKLRTDKQVALAWYESGQSMRRARHIDRIYYFINDCIESK